MRSILGECKRKLRSTPTPCAMRRTVNVCLAPEPRQPITTPSKTWIRSRFPSTTLACTLTVSPGVRAGTFSRSVSFSRRSITLDTAESLPRMVCSSASSSARQATAGAHLCLGAPPAGDLGVVAGEKHVGDPMALELGRPGVVRILDQVRAERLLSRRIGAAQNPRDQAADGIDHDQGGQLAAGQHEVADRELAIGQLLRHPLIHTLVAPADQVAVGLTGQRPGQTLGEDLSRGAEEDHRARPVPLADGFEDGLGLEHHPGASAVGHVVDLAMLVVGVVPKVVDVESDPAGAQGPTSHAVCQRAGEELGKEGQDLEDHVCAPVSSGIWTTMRWSSRSIDRTTLRIMGTRPSPAPSVTRSTSLAGYSRTSATHPIRRPLASWITGRPTSWKW